MGEISSSNLSTSSNEVRQILRQAGFVSLYFFIKYIMGALIDTTDMNSNLHLDLANFRQDLLSNGCRGAIFIPRGHLKDLDVNEPILTYNRGWVKHGDLTTKDYVFSPQGKPVKVLAISERYFKPCLKLTFLDGAEIITGKEHLWRRVNHKRFRPYFGKREGKYKYKVGSISYREDEIVPAQKLKLKDDIGVLENPLYYPEKQLPIHPYILGAWLGDGTSASLNMTCDDKDIEIMRNFERFGYPIRKNKTRFVYGFGNGRGKGNLSSIFRENNLLRNKHIPEIYFISSIEQRYLLLQGLMDTDGTTQRGTATFSNISKKLAEGVYRLAASLGLRPRFRRQEIKVNDKPYFFFQVSFQHFKDRNCFLLPRKAIKGREPSLHRNYRGIVKIEETLPMETSCIMVEGGMYVVGETFLPTHNSAIGTEGGSTWEILRDPNIKIRISGSTGAKAEGFHQTVKAQFDTNQLIEWLYPEYYVKAPKSQERWSLSEIVLPNRTLFAREATLEHGGVGQASEGHHYNLHVVDDMIGLDDLGADRSSTMDMIKTRNWFWGSESTLLTNLKKDRVIVVGTRYAIDDVYDEIIKKAHEHSGTKLKNYHTNPSGEWKVYYRMGIEDGKVIYPERFTLKKYKQIEEDDRFTFISQYMNDPQETGLAELVSYKTKDADMEYDEVRQTWYIYWKESIGNGSFLDVRHPLEEFDLIQACDPAGTEKRVSSRTSRSVVGVMATHSSGRKIILSINAGYVEPTVMFEWMFGNKRKFKGFLRTTYFEANAGFRALANVLKEEQNRRGEFLNLRTFPSTGDKTVRIRNDLQPEYEKGNIYALKNCKDILDDEKNSFPQSNRMDVLDVVSTLIRNCLKPPSEDEIEEEEERKERRLYSTSNVTGY